MLKKLILDEIERTEQKNNWEAVRIEFYSSYSPCRKCCKLIEEFLRSRRECKMSIAFTCVFLHTDGRNRSALRELYSHRSVTELDVFRRKEWKVLQDVGILALTLRQAREMRKWDYYWRKELEDILESDTVDSTEYDEDLSTDGVPTTSNEDEEDYLPSQAEFEEMKKKVKEAIRRRNHNDLLQLIVSVVLISTLLYFLWFLISRFIY